MLLKNAKILNDAFAWQTGDLKIENGRIAALGDRLPDTPDSLDCTGCTVTPGLIDIHNARIAETASLSPYDYVLPNGFNEVKKNLLLPFPNAEISANYNISASDQNFGY